MSQSNDFLGRYGPVAVITGASSGIGRGFAEVLAARGFDLVLTARRQDRLAELAARLAAQHGTNCRQIVLDLSRPDAPEALASQTADLDVGLLVSNAGFPIKGEHAGQDAAELTEMVMLNCHAPIQLTRLFIPRLRTRGKGGIILTGSVEGFLGFPYSAAYSASKGLVRALGEALWAELRPDGIDVLTLCPGPTDTEAPTRVGIDIHDHPHVMQPDATATVALDNITEGPTLVPSPFWAEMFEQMAAAPRAATLEDMAAREREHRGHS